MMLLAQSTAASEAFWQGLWSGVFELIALAVVAFTVHVLYQRVRARADARQELIDEIDEFAIGLYRPRKLYQILIDRDPASTALPEAEAERQRLLVQLLGELIETIGRFRSVQVKLIPLFGYHEGLFADYLAIWRYLKHIRGRMEQRQSLFLPHEDADSTDAFYRLLDSFRFRVSTEPFVSAPPRRIQPPAELLDRAQRRGLEVYAQFFGVAPAEAREPAAPGRPPLGAGEGPR